MSGPLFERLNVFKINYFDRNIEIIKTIISVPVLARQILFESGRKALR